MNLKELRELQVSSGIASDIKETEWITQEDLDFTKSNSFEEEPTENAKITEISCTNLMEASGWYYFRNGDPDGWDKPGTCSDDIAWRIAKKNVDEVKVFQDKPCKSYVLKTKITPYQLGVYKIEVGKDYWIRTVESGERSGPKKTHWLKYTGDWIQRDFLDGKKCEFRFKNSEFNGWYNLFTNEPKGHIWTMTDDHAVTRLTGKEKRHSEQNRLIFKFHLSNPNFVVPTFEIEEFTRSERLRVESDNAIIRHRREGIQRELFRILHAGKGSGPI